MSSLDVVASAMPQAAEESAAVSHLLAQVSFLHREVDRLEAELTRLRARHVEELLARNNTCAAAAQSRCDTETGRSTAQACRVATDTMASSADERHALSQRCSALQRQLASVHAKCNAMAVEKAALRAQLHALHMRRCDDAMAAAATTSVSSAHGESPQPAAEAALSSCAQVADGRHAHAAVQVDVASHAVAAPLQMSCAVQAGATVSDAAAQVDACVLSACCDDDDDRHAETAATMQPHHVLSHALATRTRECDALRGRLCELTMAHDDAMAQLAKTQEQLGSASEGHACAAAEAERLSVLVHALQMRCSELAGTQRDLVDKLAQAEATHAQALDACASLQRSQREWRAQEQRYERDVAQLVQSRNYASEQFAALARDAEDARAQLHTVVQREAQQAIALRTTQEELRTVHAAYVASVRELDEMRARHAQLASDLDAAQASLVAKDECVMLLQAQQRDVDAREQQLALDVQALEHEQAQLHRQLLHRDGAAAEWERRCRAAEQAQVAAERVLAELQQHVAELSKQLVIVDGECVMLRQQCAAAEEEAAQQRSAHMHSQEQCRALGDAHAHLRAQQLMSAAEKSTVQRGDDDARGDGVDGVNSKHNCCDTHIVDGDVDSEMRYTNMTAGAREQIVDDMRAQLASERAERARMEEELAAARVALDEAVQSNERLQRLLRSQAQTLAHLSA